jgi:hypothetical protein
MLNTLQLFTTLLPHFVFPVPAILVNGSTAVSKGLHAVCLLLFTSRTL